MPTIRNRLHPFSDVGPHDRINLYSLDQTGLAGQLVKIATGSANPQTTEVDGFSSTPMGVTVNGAYSMRYETLWKVSPTVSGDTRFSALGVSEYSTLEYDENGFPLKFFTNRGKEIGAVISGETIPVVTKGLIGIWGNYIDQSLGAPQPGHLAVVSRSGNGLIAAVSPTNTTNFGTGATVGQAYQYSRDQVVGKWVSSLPTSTNTGLANEFSAQGGYAFLQLNCTS